MVVIVLRSPALRILGLLSLMGACGGRAREGSGTVGRDPTSSGGASESTGGSSASSGGSIADVGGSAPMGAGGTAGQSVAVGEGGGLETAGGASANSGGAWATSGSAGASAVGNVGGTSGDTASNEAGAGGASSNSSCSAAWGTPSDPGYRGLRGTLNGQALSVDGKDINSGIGFCFPDGPGATPGGVGGYFPLPGMSLRISSCRAEITSPSDTVWHDLDVQLAAEVSMPVMGTGVTNEPIWDGSVARGTVHLDGEGPDGPITIDAEFCLDLVVIDSCAPPPPKVG